MFVDNTIRFRIAVLLSTAALFLVSPIAVGQSPLVGPPMPEELGPSVKVDPIPVPKDELEIRQKLKEFEGDLEVLQFNADQLAKKSELSDGEKAFVAAVKAKADAIKIYKPQLEEYLELLLQIHGLEDSTAASKLADELSALQKTIDDVQQDALRRQTGVTAEEFAQVEADLEAVKTNLATRIKAQEERDQRKAGLPTRLETLKAEAEASQTALNKGGSEFEIAKTKAVPDSKEYFAAALALDKLKLETGLVLLRMARLEQEVKRDSLLSAQAEQRLPLLRQLVAEHEKRVERYKQLRARAEIQTAKEELERAKTQPHEVSPYELAFLDLEVRVKVRLQELDQLQRELGTKDRFVENEFEQLKKDIAEDVRDVSAYMGVLERKSGEKIKGYFKRLGQLERDRITERDRVLQVYDNVLDDRVRISDRIDQIVDEELRDVWRNINELERSEVDSATVVRLAPKRKELRDNFDKGIADIRAHVDSLVTRLAEAGKLLSEHVDYLAAQRSRMYWSYLRVQDQPIWKFSWEEARNEWNSEAAKRSASIDKLQKGVDQIPTRTALTVSAVLLAILIASWFIRKRLLASASALEQKVGAEMVDPEQTIAPVSDRLHLQFIRFLARSSPVVLPTAAAWFWVEVMSPLDGRLASTFIGTLMIAGLVSGLISTLFSRSKPRYRLVPCSNVVAAHYRKSLRALLYVSVLLVPYPLLLTFFDGAPYARHFLWSVYKIIALVIVLVFALPRQTVLRVVGRPQDVRYQLIYLTVSTGYPILYLSIVALLVLQILGFGPLVTYIIAGVSGSILVICAAILVVRYVRDLVLRFGQKIATVREQADNPASADREHALALAAGREVTLLDRTSDSFDEQLWLGIGLSIFRWVVAVAALAVMMSFWGVSRVDMQRALDYVLIPAAENRPPITIGRGLAAIAVLLLTWLFSKGIRAFLDARVYPAYASLDRGGRVAISTLLHYTFIFLGLYFSLYIMQIPLGALTVVLGTLGLGLGLGLQPVFINFLSGIIILFERHVKVGDLIEVNGVLGEVSGISLRATTIKTYDNVDMVIPNADFVSGSVVNWTMNDPRIRGKIEVGVDYDSDVRLVERLLIQVARESKLVLKEPPPRVRFVHFGDSALNFTLYAWFYNAADRFEFMTEGRYRILELFREHNITIPFPEQTLNINEGTPLRVQVENVVRDPEAMRRKEDGREEGTRPGTSTERPAGRR